MHFGWILKETNKFWNDFGYKTHIFSKNLPTFYTDSMQLAYVLTATDMRMRENDVTLGIPKSSR